MMGIAAEGDASTMFRTFVPHKDHQPAAMQRRNGWSLHEKYATPIATPIYSPTGLWARGET
jgi:hypothetical protein